MYVTGFSGGKRNQTTQNWKEVKSLDINYSTSTLLWRKKVYQNLPRRKEERNYMCSLKRILEIINAFIVS